MVLQFVNGRNVVIKFFVLFVDLRNAEPHHIDHVPEKSTAEQLDEWDEKHLSSFDRREVTVAHRGHSGDGEVDGASVVWDPCVLAHCDFVHRVDPILFRIHVCQNKGYQMACTQQQEEQDYYSELVLVVLGLHIAIYFLQVLSQIPSFDEEHDHDQRQ